jgi:lipoprotein LprG
MVGVLVAALALLTTACTKDEAGSGAAKSPQQVLAAARQKLDGTTGLRLTLGTKDLPKGVSGITEANGVATRAPAFDGTLKVIFGGSSVEVPVIAVGGKVFAQLPLTTGWSVVDLADYGAPDPAAFLGAGTGFSSLLPLTTGLAKGASVRGGTDNAEVLTEYTGTVPGAAMKKVIPSSTGESFAAVYSVTDTDELRQAAFTGVFYPRSASMTYTVVFAAYGTTREITAP